ncbi:hypothetical protein BBK14_05530 [Parafrankia soli]|uniref:Uncharacterized protein n=1 Tax=Parafrankia soli TaxID=2599596 RepID=A0A1S1PWP4_9ACTN|nr:hypothetical protein BBK14_05530 [Parafrankia soli]
MPETDVRMMTIQEVSRRTGFTERRCATTNGWGGTLELAVINPVGIFGPVLGADYASSIDLVRRLLAGAMPAIPACTPGSSTSARSPSCISWP